MMVAEKRFEVGNLKIQDNAPKGRIYLLDMQGGVNALCSLINGLNDKSNRLEEENEQLKKEIHLMHMRSMFSTVKSFKGNVSERYVYSEETDNIYDTANHYGQYHKILTKKEIVMLLNEYETIIKELNEVKR